MWIKRVWHNARYTKRNARLLSVCLVEDGGDFVQAFANSCSHTGKPFLDFANPFDLICGKFSNRAENQFGSVFRCLFMNLPARVCSESISGNDKDIESCHRFTHIFACCISFGPFRYLRVKIRNIGIKLFNQFTPPSAVSTSSAEEYTAYIEILVHVDFHSNPFRPYRTWLEIAHLFFIVPFGIYILLYHILHNIAILTDILIPIFFFNFNLLIHFFNSLFHF
mgnify:CR=1 FL=1